MSIFEGLLVTVVGMLVVFSALVLLILMTTLMSKALAGNAKYAPAPAAAAAPSTVTPVSAPDAVSAPMLAAISAAIATETGSQADGFRIVSIKRK